MSQVLVDLDMKNTYVLYDKKLHEEMIKDPTIATNMLKKSGYNIEILKVSKEVETKCAIPVSTNQYNLPYFKTSGEKYHEYNNFIYITNSNIHPIMIKFSN